MSFLDEMLPETAEAFGQMRSSIFKDGYLDLKTKELIAIASSVLMRCQFCVDTHSQRAIAAGATKEEIAETISVAMFIAAGTQIGWTNIYRENIYDKIFEKDKGEEGKDKGEEDCCCCCKD
ncbi:carboxymuconolactone decarboxylase family protein [Methanosarcina sp. DH1]|uniref:carboxymuconolactone decarboxylase family protein n=1 Tax=Methanosarcina sp. DH1 TaxID=2605695 RepID=UPI001E2EE347|nr:carboxymuconolactone decarboxylase family protein [Methanosarcina sp. DH1]MCC4765758.1 carboxymuconolactone decarboxylase family protein [Methanosarcina sp. DH1]